MIQVGNIMTLLTTALLFILVEAITEALIKKRYPQSFIFKGWVQWVIAIGLFLIWLFAIALPFDKYYVSTVKLILGFIFVRFLIFDVVWNLTFGVKWNYYGTTKLYDRIMSELGGFGWFMKGVIGLIGICFLIGIQ
jgi:hypothetical protein